MYLILYLFWLILNGRLTVEICLFGLGILVPVSLICRVLFHYTWKKEFLILKKLPLFFCYAFVLFWEILKANIEVIRFILNERRAIEPALVVFSADLKTEFGRFILANSITLTPGTITIAVEGNRFTVHCLKPSLLDTSENSVFLRWIRRLEA